MIVDLAFNNVLRDIYLVSIKYNIYIYMRFMLYYCKYLFVMYIDWDDTAMG